MMKLKVLPPTLRKNNRYLAIDIKIEENSLTKDELVSIVWDSCVRYWGESGSSNFNLWVMRFKHYGPHNYKAIVRCQRDFVDDVRCALALQNKFNNNRIAITTIGLSGTIKSCEKFI